MRKRFFGRVLSAALSVAMVFTSVVPSYAMEGIDNDIMEDGAEDTEEVEDAEVEETQVGEGETAAEETIGSGESAIPETTKNNNEDEKETSSDDVTQTENNENKENTEEIPVEEEYTVSGLVGDPTDPFKVTYNNNGATSGTAIEDTVVTGENPAYATKPSDWVKTGYTLSKDGWNTKADGSGATIAYGSAIGGITENTEVFADWIPNTYQVRFNLANVPDGAKEDSDSVAMEIQDFTYGTAQELSENTYSFVGYYFNGWAIAENSTEIVYGDGEEVSNLTAEDGAIVDLYTVWAPKSYEIVLDPGEGNGETIADFAWVVYGEEYTLPDLPDSFSRPRVGTQFGGWKWEGLQWRKHPGETVPVSELTDGTSGVPVILVAQWIVPTACGMNVYDIIDGDIENPVYAGDVMVDTGDRIIPELNKAGMNSRDGYTFGGFYLDPECTQPIENDAVCVDPMDLYAKFTTYVPPVDTFKVTFNTNGGSSVLSQYVKKGSTVTEPADPTKELAAFEGWYADEALKTPFNFAETKIEQATTIYAKWTAVHRIAFQYEKKISEEEIHTTVYKFDEVLDKGKVTRIADPKLTGNKFAGWYEDSALTKEFNFDQEITKDTIIYAKFTPITFTVHFDSNTGSGTMADLTVAYGSGVKLTKNAFTKDHYTFDSWTTKKVTPANMFTEGDVFEDESTDISTYCDVDGKVITLYAFWKSTKTDVNIHYGYDCFPAGHTPDRQTETSFAFYGRPMGENLPTDIERTGYYFDGWYNQAEGGTKIDLSKINDGTIKDVYAHWTAIDYTVSFHSNLAKDTVVTKNFKITDTDLNTAVTFAGLFTDAAVVAEAAKRTKSTVFWTSINSQFTESSFTKAAFIASEFEATGAKAKAVKVDVYANWDPAYNYNVVFIYGDSNENYDYSSKYVIKSLGSTYGNKYGHIESVAADENLYLTGNEFVNRQYKLTGWTYSVNGGTAKNIGTKVTLKNLAKAGETVVFTAVWATKETEYKLNLVTNGGKIAADSETKELKKTYKNSETYKLPKMEKTGYTFLGWYANGYGYPYYQVTKVGKDGDNGVYGQFGDVTLHALFDINVYRVSFDKQGGTVSIPDIEYYFYYNESRSLKGVTYSKPGYKFSHWEYKDDKNETKKITATGTVKYLTTAHDKLVTLKAVWTPIKYSIGYSLGSGATIDKATAKNYTPVDAATITIKDPVRTGYTFSGWTLSMKDKKASTTSALAESGKTLTAGSYGNIVLTANWTVNQYGFKYLDSAGNVLKTVPASSNAVYSGTYDFTADAKEISLSDTLKTSKKSVKGFALKSTDTKTKYNTNKSYKVSDVVKNAKPEGNIITLYVITEDQKFFYELENGVTGQVKTVSYVPTNGASFKAPAVAGYTFKDWTVTGGTANTDYVVDKNAITIKKPAADTANGMHFTANYESNKYKIVLMPNAGDVYVRGMKSPVSTKGAAYNGGAEIEYASTSELVAPDWVREGYTFVGFSTKKSIKSLDDLVNTVGGLKVNSKNEATLYAIWSVNAYEIQYTSYGYVYEQGESDKSINVNYGNTKLTTSVAYGKTVTLPAKLANEGYTFLGWSVYASNKDNLDVQTNKAGYATKIGPKNKTKVTVTPVFSENTYTLKLSPNGGSAYVYGEKVSKTVTLRTNVKYSEDILDDLTAAIGGINSNSITAGKKGCYVTGVALSANGKSSIYHYAYGDESGITSIKYLTGKNKGTVTVYITWAQHGAIPKGQIRRAELSSTGTLNVDLEAYYTKNEIQYSTDPAFKKNVVSVVKDHDYTDSIATELTGKVYYVRARLGYVDSLGNTVYGAWSNVERANKSAQ